MSGFRWLRRWSPDDEPDPNPLCYGERCGRCGTFLDRPGRDCPMGCAR